MFKTLKVIAGLVIGLGFLVIWKNLIDIKESLLILRQANVIFVVISVVIGITVSLISSLKLKILYQLIKVKLPLLFLLAGGYATYLVASLIPFYSGGFSMAYLISKKANISYKKSFSILILDFLISVSIITSIATFFINPFLPVISLSLFILIFSMKKNKELILKAYLINFFVLLVTNMQLYAIFRAFSLYPNFNKLFLTKSIFSLINLLPGIPLKIGQFEAGGILAFSHLLGLPSVTVGAAMVLLHSISVLTGVVLALILIGQIRNGKK